MLYGYLSQAVSACAVYMLASLVLALEPLCYIVCSDDMKCMRMYQL